LKKQDGLSKFIRDAWDLSIERGKIHKALRLLNKQSWSIEFLTALLQRAAKNYGSHLEMTITGPGGFSVTVKTTDGSTSNKYKDDDIMQHLDDEVKVNQFIAMMQGHK
jgi:hypothetical protein